MNILVVILNFYSLTIITNGFEIDSNAGIIDDIGGGEIEVNNIPIDESLTIYATNIGEPNCEETFIINPPNCDCPNINPPTSNGPYFICAGSPTPELSVTLEVGQTANWYDSPNNGTLLLGESTTYTPSNNLSAGTFTFYVETQDLASGCLSSIQSFCFL